MQSREFAQLRWQEQAPVGVELQIGGVTDHQALQAARLRLQGRQRHELALDLFPFGQRVDEQALVAIDGDDELPAALLAQPFAVTRGHDHPSLVVHRELGRTPKHVFDRRRTPICSHFFPLAATIEIAARSCQCFWPGFFPSFTKTYTRNCPQRETFEERSLTDQPLGLISSNEDEEEGEPADKPGSVVDSHSSATHVAVRL